MTLDVHVTGIWCGQIGGGVGKIRGTILGVPIIRIVVYLGLY